jgi:hypothetical protein
MMETEFVFKYFMYVIASNGRSISVRRCWIVVNEMFIIYRHW